MRTRNLCAGLLMAAVALSCLAGCKKDEGETVVLGTQFEKTVSVQKTYLGEGNTVCWSTGDKVKINDAEYTCGSSISVTASDHYYAVYPCSSSNTVSESGGTVEIPVVQTYTVDGNGVQQLNGPMAARLDSRDKNGILYFKNLYSLLKVKVCSENEDFTVSYITVTATGSEAKPLSGTYTYTFRGATTEDTASAPVVGDITSSGKNSVTLVCSSNNVVTANTDRDFYLAVHPINGHSLKVDVHGVREGKSVVYTYSSETRHKLNRSRIGGIGINLQQLQPVNDDYVDLGLSVVWATRNVGADNPEDYGDHFAWGETEPYYTKLTWTSAMTYTIEGWKTGKEKGYVASDKDWSSYCGSETFTEWNPAPYGADHVLLPAYDAATANWGAPWRMPTKGEWQELRENCTWIITENGLAGVSNKTGYGDRVIVFPLAGRFIGTALISVIGNAGTYWSSSLSDTTAKRAFVISAVTKPIPTFSAGGDSPRCSSASVRPVKVIEVNL